jgi:hypothetical protein
MHHCLWGEKAPYVSFGVPLTSILAKRSLYGGNPDVDAVESHQPMVMVAFPKDKHRESRKMGKFDTKIAEAAYRRF